MDGKFFIQNSFWKQHCLVEFFNLLSIEQIAVMKRNITVCMWFSFISTSCGCIFYILCLSCTPYYHKINMHAQTMYNIFPYFIRCCIICDCCLSHLSNISCLGLPSTCIHHPSPLTLHSGLQQGWSLSKLLQSKDGVNLGQAASFTHG